MTAGCPSSPPHTIYFLCRMSVSSELSGSYVTREKNERAMKPATVAQHNAVLPISEPFSSQVFDFSVLI